MTDVAGTTRDTLEEFVSVKGVPLELIDTAGIHHTEDQVEKIGVERSKKAIAQADLILLLLDGSQELTEEDRQLLELTAGKKRIIVLNKTDLGQKLTAAEIAKESGSEVISTSIMMKENLDELEALIKKLFFKGIENSNDQVLVTNQRQAGLLAKAKQQLADVANGLETGMPVDLVQIDFTGAWESLGEITGDSAPDELINDLFSQFCLGK